MTCTALLQSFRPYKLSLFLTNDGKHSVNLPPSSQQPMDRTKFTPYIFIFRLSVSFRCTSQYRRKDLSLLYFIATLTFILIIQSFFSSELLSTRLLVLFVLITCTCVSSVNVGRPCLTKTHMQNTCEVCVSIHGLE